MVRAKKHLGQHFLKDPEVAYKIAQAIDTRLQPTLLEVGPGTGALTQHLVTLPQDLWLSEIDRDSVSYLNEHFPNQFKLQQVSFLDGDWTSWIGDQFAVVGNFPYNISSQIVFKMLDMKSHVPQLVGMFQKELAERICANPGSKTYGVISVLSQAYYHCEYLFTVSENVFIPPPKVKSGVIKMLRKDVELACDPVRFKQVVKATFNQRRKTIRNGLKSLGVSVEEHPFLTKRPEQLSVADFVVLTNHIFTPS